MGCRERGGRYGSEKERWVAVAEEGCGFVREEREKGFEVRERERRRHGSQSLHSIRLFEDNSN